MAKMHRSLTVLTILVTHLFALTWCGAIPTALAETPQFKGQTVYVPVYSHIYSGDRELPFYLAATLSISIVWFEPLMKAASSEQR